MTLLFCLNYILFLFFKVRLLYIFIVFGESGSRRKWNPAKVDFGESGIRRKWNPAKVEIRISTRRNSTRRKWNSAKVEIPLK